ncbi:hypothetical protein [Agrococcus carbonis]|uniref:Uncharacterized protein n=1 Tax=Agrococcus carbonis TaxID=684552 RepID=A0A1H1QJY3_9MICO|nr:hypothetical protein [Agrococcus carbonis]SDS23778.1 hypothetical protein SAMN04489719_1859 [Agrococcus carbonis]
MSTWPYTTKARHIVEFQQDGSDIVSLGWDIWYLGLYMDTAADIMQKLASGDDGQQGEAVDELRKKVGDAHVQLHLASELYMPIGSALKHYGAEVRDTIRPQINTRHQTASDAWNTYVALPGDKDGRSYFLGIGKPEEGSPEEEQHEAEDQAKLQAWNDWIDAADSYDAAYDTWETAWNSAVDEIDDGFSDDLKDSRWEKFKQFLDVALEVLKWAGLIVGILALVIGGPILAAIAAAIAVVALVGTLILAFEGDRSWGDVAWAVIDVIPVGKLGKLFQAGEKMKFVKEMGKNFDPKTYKDGWNALKKLDGFGEGASKGIRDGALALVTGKNSSGWSKLWTDNMDTSAWRAATNPGLIDRAAEKVIRFNGVLFEGGFTVVNNGFKLQNWTSTISGGEIESWRNSNPVLRFLF